MKHIFFILAHKNLKQVMRLAKVLSSEFDCLIHLDVKYGDIVHDSDFNPNHENIYFTSKRLSIDLASFSMVKVIQLMLEETKRLEVEHDIAYSYAGLISGQCYPIKKVNYIKRTLDCSYPKLIIDSLPIDKLGWLESVYSRHRFITIHNFLNRVIKFNSFNFVSKLPLYTFEYLYTLICRSPISKSNDLELKICGGSAWWILPLELIEDIFLILEKTPIIKKIYNHILTPEEHFFQSIISTYFNSEYLHDMDFQDGPTLNFFEHPKHGKSLGGHPFTLDSKDFSLLLESKKLFARKFDESFDNNIIDLIEKTLL